MLCLVLIGGCGDVVSTRYKAYREAEADQLFVRGWLPGFIPHSSYDIKVTNDLDLGTSQGEFRFHPIDVRAFTAKLIMFHQRKSPFVGYDGLASNRARRGHVAYEYAADGGVWVFFVNRAKGHAYYYFWLEK